MKAQATITRPSASGFDVYQLLGDESLNIKQNEIVPYTSRTNPANNWSGGKCTPSVMRFEKSPRMPTSDYQVDISPLQSAYIALNGETSMNDPKTRYLFAGDTALFNSNNDIGYPLQSYLVMQGNRFKALEIVGNYLKFETLKPSSNVTGMSYVTHPWFIHRFDLVCWDKDRTPPTYHKANTPQGEIFYYLVTAEGFGYMPLAWVVKV